MAHQDGSDTSSPKALCALHASGPGVSSCQLTWPLLQEAFLHPPAPSELAAAFSVLFRRPLCRVKSQNLPSCTAVTRPLPGPCPALGWGPLQPGAFIRQMAAHTAQRLIVALLVLPAASSPREGRGNARSLGELWRGVCEAGQPRQVRPNPGVQVTALRGPLPHGCESTRMKQGRFPGAGSIRPSKACYSLSSCFSSSSWMSRRRVSREGGSPWRAEAGVTDLPRNPCHRDPDGPGH